jgi:hypothetical protein
MADLIEKFFSDLSERHRTHALVDETAYYPPIEQLFTAVGASLSPAVKCFSGLKNLGAGMPDLGLFTPDQYRPGSTQPRSKQAPSRGVIEAKSPSENVRTVAKSKQVQDYLDEYGLVLVTSCREFLLLKRGASGATEELDSFSLGGDEGSFWELASYPRKTSAAIGTTLVDFLKRVMLRPAPITKPDQLAWLLASYAQEAKVRVEAADPKSLEAFRNELTNSLGITFSGQEGEEFFRSTFVQTLFYGLFSAWILWSRSSAKKPAVFDWRTVPRSFDLPVIGPLFSGLTLPHLLGPLNLEDVLDWSTEALSRVDQAAFFSRFEEDHAIQYFYEPFLEQFDPDLRKSLGVWYTPTEVVRYMVEKVDQALRKDLGLRDGLADHSVYILDPCCGTGSYLVETLRRIAKTAEEKFGKALVAAEVKTAATGRVFGFEILPAPFVVSHLQLGLLLQELGSALQPGKRERASVYLTNSLTGWEPPTGPQTRLPDFFQLEMEKEAAADVKQKQPILVVIGNPPYNAFAGTSPEEEYGLVEPYKQGLTTDFGIKKFNLDDLYIRFLRVAERRIVEGTGKGVVCYISNNSFLNGPSYVVLRKRFLGEFDVISIDNLNGDSRATGKLTPDGKPDPSVFSTEREKVGIRVGTAISTWVKKGTPPGTARIGYRDFWGDAKRSMLLAIAAGGSKGTSYTNLDPDERTRYSLRPFRASPSYLTWPSVLEISAGRHHNGPIERRGNALIPMQADRARLTVLTDYFDPTKPDSEIERSAPRLMKSSGEFDGAKTRKALIKRGTRFDSKLAVSYPFHAFDLRVAYLDAHIQPLFSRPSPELLALREIPGNAFLITRDTADKSPEGPPFYYSSLVCDYDSISGHARHFPLLLPSDSKTQAQGQTQKTITGKSQPKRINLANLSPRSLAYLRSLGLASTDLSGVQFLWWHIIAIGFSPRYLQENEDGVRSGWPRIPLPESKDRLLASAQLGSRIADTLDPKSETFELARGTRPELAVIGVPIRVGGGQLKSSGGDLEVRAGWGHGTAVVMPGQGRIVDRPYTPHEREEIERGAAMLGVTPADCWTRLGDETSDVYLNDVACWQNIPSQVWEYYLGGYQVLKKWLSYREYSILGRPLEVEEVHEFRRIAWRLVAIRLLEPELDRNYEAVKGHVVDWSKSNDGSIPEHGSTSVKRGFGGQASFGPEGKLRGTASLKRWKKD